MANPELMEAFAGLFEYPDRSYPGRVETVLRALAGTDSSADAETFARALAGLGLEKLEELSYRTFDGSPQCVPYLSVHLFGEESYKRAELMTGLAAAYARVGLGRGAELPDHLAEVLRAGPRLEEWPDLVRSCLLPAVWVMVGEAQRAKNPYEALLRALFSALTREVGLSASEATTLAARHRVQQRIGEPVPSTVACQEATCG